MNIYRIIARKPGAAYIIAEKIQSYKIIEGDAKKHFLCNDPVIYEDKRGGLFSAALQDIITLKENTNIIESLGYYKIPVELI